MKEGRFAEEIAPVEIPQRKGDPIVVDTDEGVRPGHDRRVARRRCGPRSTKDGTITAGNASQISDGGAAVIVMSREQGRRARASRRSPSWSSYGMVAGPRRVAAHPAVARDQARARAESTSTVADIDLFEINEAFAAVGLASMRDLGITDDVVNVNGGAIALGHPVGMSGTRVVLTLINELRRRGGGTGAAALCGGGGQGDAAIVRTL